MIELGVPGGRCGCRSTDAALALAKQAAQLPGLRLRGLELYEGVLHGDDPQPQVEALLRDAAQLACDMASLVDGEFILTGAGTVWYDVVCNIWLAAEKPDNCRIVIRPAATSLTTPGSTTRHNNSCLPAILWPAIWQAISHLRWNWSPWCNRCRKLLVRW